MYIVSQSADPNPFRGTAVKLELFVYATAGAKKKVPSVYTLLISAIYLFHSTQEAWGTVFWKHTVSLQSIENNRDFELRGVPAHTKNLFS